MMRWSDIGESLPDNSSDISGISSRVISDDEPTENSNNSTISDMISMLDKDDESTEKSENSSNNSDDMSMLLHSDDDTSDNGGSLNGISKLDSSSDSESSDDDLPSNIDRQNKKSVPNTTALFKMIKRGDFEAFMNNRKYADLLSDRDDQGNSYIHRFVFIRTYILTYNILLYD